MGAKILWIFLSLFVGIAVAAKSGRIAGGSTAQRGQFPWHAKIEAFNGQFTSICGGALIRYDYVLTSARCIYDSVDIIIRFGMIDRLEGPTSAIFRITSRDYITIHENYTSTGFDNNLALLYLEGAETLVQDPYVDVIELPTDDDADYDFVGLEGNTTGFGLLNDEDPPLLSMLLQYVTLPIISEDVCRQTHGGNFNYDDVFCTDGSQGSTCIGDEGAPFVAEVNGRKVLAGVGSVPLTLCTQGWPAIFTNLLTHLDWIDDTVNEPPVVDPPTTTVEPPSSDKCNCVCRCYVCPCDERTKQMKENFQKRWVEK